MITIGLFGTCGVSNWREPFTAYYDANNIAYFNPQVAHWTPDLAAVEADHLAHDHIVLFTVTAETFATGSLAETGFSLLSAMHQVHPRFVVIYVDPSLAQELLNNNPAMANESLRARALVTAHLKMRSNANVFFVNSLDDMLALSIQLHAVATTLLQLRETFHQA